LAIRGVDVVLQSGSVEGAEAEEDERQYDKNGERDRLRIPGDLVPLEFHISIISQGEENK